jgi:hypothetical protein
MQTSGAQALQQPQKARRSPFFHLQPYLRIKGSLYSAPACKLIAVTKAVGFSMGSYFRIEEMYNDISNDG